MDSSRNDKSSDGEVCLRHRTLGRRIRNVPLLAKCENLPKHSFFDIIHGRFPGHIRRGNWRFAPMSKRTRDEDSDARKRVAQESHLAALPVELIELIALEAGPRGFKNLAATCQRMRRVLSDNPDIQSEPARIERAIQRFSRNISSETILCSYREITTFLCLPNNKPHGLYERRTPDGVLIHRSYFQKGHAHGLSQTWNTRGLLVFRGNFVNGLAEGIHETWSPSGTVTSRCTYRAPGKRMIDQYWYDTGIPSSVVRWDDDNQAHGPSEYFNKQGVRIRLFHYVHGKEHGVFQQWHHNGQLADVVTKINDVLHGMIESWHPNGMRKVRSYFVDGKQEGVDKRWDESGQLIYRAYYIRGEQNGTRWEKASDGTQRISNWINGKPHGATQEIPANGSNSTTIEHFWDGKIVESSALSADGTRYNFDFIGEPPVDRLRFFF